MIYCVLLIFSFLLCDIIYKYYKNKNRKKKKENSNDKNITNNADIILDNDIDILDIDVLDKKSVVEYIDYIIDPDESNVKKTNIIYDIKNNQTFKLNIKHNKEFDIDKYRIVQLRSVKNNF